MTLRPLLAAALCCACATSPKPAAEPAAEKPAAPKGSEPMPRLTATPHAAELLSTPAEDFARVCDDAIAKAKQQVVQLKALPAGQDAQALALYDEVVDLLSNAGARAGLAKEVHPDLKFREACEACEQKIEAYNVELSLDRPLYDALSKVDQKALDPVASFWLFKTLREFRRSGVDRDEATRTRVKTLNEELVKLGQAFGRNIRDDVRTVQADPRDLEGLPADWLAAHPRGKDGKVAVTTNTPDYLPVMTYAKGVKLREQLWRAYRDRAYPKNVEVLNQMLGKRHELATLLGYESWAAYVTETKMVKNAGTARDFIDQGRAATEARARADMAMLIERKKKDVPNATAIEPWEHQFYEDRVRAESFGLDSQALRPYFEYGNVEQGVMSITSKLFGVRYVAVKDAKVWHPDVETFDVLEGEQLIGRIHLDMHPRDGKYKHAAQFGLTVGRGGRELPEAVLVCNFPARGELMEHAQVETFFHEFGHLLHEVFAGRQRWAGVSGVRTEWDFVEVPSMLLQEWPLDGTALKAFAKHHQTGAPMPDTLLAQLKRAKEFGAGLDSRRQFFLSAVSLAFHEKKPGFDTNQVLKEVQEKFVPFRREWVPGSHFELGFGHLDGYSAIYYTYQWSTVIAKDLLTRFREKGMLDSDLATEYRKKVLDPGGSVEADKLVRDFLGRPHSFAAYEAWLNNKG
ncbi:MAG: Zn-dependent oligopeptidase [Archangiaceae bacterium]|nr:Zn-dependent oligopeptidase [Archangiaceae bacterium]